MSKLDAKHIVMMLLAASVFLAWCTFIVVNPIVCSELVSIVKSIRDIGESDQVRKLKEEINFLKGLENGQ